MSARHFQADAGRTNQSQKGWMRNRHGLSRECMVKRPKEAPLGLSREAKARKLVPQRNS